MHVPEIYCLTLSAEPVSGLGQSSTADQPWMVHGGISMGPFKWSHIYIRQEVLSHELQNWPCQKTFELEYLEIFIKLLILRWSWVFLERTRILSGIQFTTYFIDLFVVETKRFVSSFV